MAENRYRLLGGPGSPYSLKLRAVLRYRKLPHDWIVPRGFPGATPELQRAGKGMIPVLQSPETGDYWADSTPIIYELEKRHEGRSVIPLEPAEAFLAHMIEDFADELLMQAMFAYRWDKPFDQQFCSRRQLAGWFGAMPAAQFEDVVARFIARQTGQLATLGPLSNNMPFLEDVYLRALDAVEDLQNESDFLFGSRPSIADFGLFGQLSQCAVDPTASEIFKKRAARAFQWVQSLDDASGVDGAWRAREQEIPTGLRALLKLMAEVYLPFLAANAQGCARGDQTFSLVIDGRHFEGRSSRYKARCLVWLQGELGGLDAGARARVRKLIANDAAFEVLQSGAIAASAIPPHAPR